MSNAGDFVIENGVLKKYVGSGGDVVVPEGVEELGDNCFQSCNVVQREHVDLNSIKLPESLKRIGRWVFEHCDGLTEVEIPDSVTDIGNWAFKNTRSLSEVKLSKSLVRLGAYAFAGCSIKTLFLPKSLRIIEEGALMNNSMQNLALPDEVERIDAKAFDGQLYSSFSLCVKRNTPAEKAAKKYSKKGKPKIVVFDEQDAPIAAKFQNAADMDKRDLEFASYIMEHSDGSEKRIGDFIIRNDYGANVYYEGSGGEVKIPEEVGDASLWHTFEKATNITSISFPGTVKTVSAVTLGSRKSLYRLVFNEGIEAITETDFFANCRELKEISIPESLHYLGIHAFQKTPWYQEHVEIVDGCHYLGRFLVDSEEDIQRATVRKGTIMICGKAFLNRTDLREVIIPDGVETIGAQAFFNCDALSTIYLPASVRLVEKWSLVCHRLKRIEIANPETEISEDAFGKESFGGIFYPEYAYIPTEVKGSPAQKKFFAYCYLTSRERFAPEKQVQLDAEVKKQKAKLLDLAIDQGNLAVLQNLAPLALTIINVDTLIEKAQSKGAAELTAFLLEWQSKNTVASAMSKHQEKELERDPMSAGELKKNWNTKKLPDGTLGITSYKGTELEILVPGRVGKTNVTAICREAFSASRYSAMGKRTTEEQITVRKAIRSVRLPENVTKIEFYAFESCESLDAVYLHASVSEINSFAFSGCKQLTIHAPAGSYAEQYAKEHSIPFAAE